MKFRIFVVVSLFALGLAACSPFSIQINADGLRGNGMLKTEERAVEGYDRIVLQNSGNVELIQGEKEGLTIEADENLLPYYTSEVRAGTLYLGMQPGIHVTFSRPPRYTIQAKTIEGLHISGSGKITSTSVESKKLDLVISGSGDILLDKVNTSALTGRISGSGLIKAAGEAKDLDYQISGSGNLRMGDLAVQTANLKLSGSGSATVWSDSKLDAAISGSGGVEYYGTPQVNMHTSGSGKVRSLGKHQ